MGAAGKAAGLALLGSRSLRDRSRRARLVARIRREAWLVGAQVELDLPDDLRVGNDVEVRVDPLSRGRFVLGPGSSIEDRVLLMFKGGSLLGGPRIELRRDVVLNLGGTLRLDGDNPVSWGSVIHCSTDVHLEPMAGIAEQVTIAD